MQKNREFTSENELTMIERLEDIPQGMSEAEEAEYWSTHMLSEALLQAEATAVEEPQHNQKSRRISLVLDEDVYQQLKVAARKKSIGYQTLLKTFVKERLQQEEKFFVSASTHHKFLQREKGSSQKRFLEPHLRR